MPIWSEELPDCIVLLSLCEPIEPCEPAEPLCEELPLWPEFMLLSLPLCPVLPLWLVLPLCASIMPVPNTSAPAKPRNFFITSNFLPGTDCVRADSGSNSFLFS